MVNIFKTIGNWFSNNKLFNNKTGVLVGIVIFVIALLLFFATPARSEELYFDAGSAIVRGETPTVGFTIVWKEEGPVKTDYELGFNLIGESTDRIKHPNQIVVHGSIVDGYKNFEMGLGFAYFLNNEEFYYTCKETFTLMARWRFSSRFHIQARHFSSAGSCRPNKGRDLLTFGYRF